MKTNRLINLKGSFNFRDMGGLATQDGVYMKSDILYRSDELSKLSDSDLEIIRKINFKTIIDLRTPNERKHKIDRLPSGQNIHIVNIPIYPTPDEPGTLKKFFWLVTGKFKKVDFRKFTKEFYCRIAFKHPSQIEEIMNLVSHPENLPALIHCNGGKDRTGFMSAIIQLLTGVPYERVMEDYLLSNDFILPRIDRMFKPYKWMTLFHLSQESMRPMLEARIEYLGETLDTIFEKYNSIPCYLQDACGVNRETITRVQQLIRQ